MNWLAHVYLSEPDTQFRLGNLLADLVKGRARAGMPPAFLRGVRCHQTIDAFTDYHPVVQRSRARIGPGLRRYAGILVDVFYDHFLARDWPRYSAVPLDDFTAELYAAAQSQPLSLPEEARLALERMIADDRLGSYREVTGIAAALGRLSVYLSRRWGRPVALEEGVEDLLRDKEGFGQDFAEFFPSLVAHVAENGYRILTETIVGHHPCKETSCKSLRQDVMMRNRIFGPPRE